MSTLLIVTTDHAVSGEIKAVADELGFRTREVPSLNSAFDWVTRQKYDAVLVDGRFEQGAPLSVIEAAWKTNPVAYAGVFNLHGAIEDALAFTLAGIRTFQFPDALSAIRQALQDVLLAQEQVQPFAILVVEDLDSPRDIICSYVEALGYERVHGVGSAAEAMRTLESNPGLYSCILTDINMPQVKGSELIAQIRSHELLSHLPIIVLTAYGTPENLLDCIRNGATGFIVKPPKKQMLLRELERARRIVLTARSPRLCKPEDAYLLEEALHRFQRTH